MSFSLFKFAQLILPYLFVCRERAVRAAVVVIVGFVPHEALKRLVIAIREIHRIPPFGFGLGLAVYIEKNRFIVKRILRKIYICSDNRELFVNRTILYINWLPNRKMCGIM